jgi:hypothetical protein
MMPDHPDLLGPSTRKPREVMKSIKTLEERNGKLVDVLPPELLLLLLNERRLVLSRVLVVRLLLIKISASDLASEYRDMVAGCMYVCITSLCQQKNENTRISLALTLP